MESTRKRRGFMKGKLVMSFYRAAKPPAAVTPYTTTIKAKPSPNSAAEAPRQKVITSSTAASVGYHHVVNQEQVSPQPKHKVTYYMPETGRDVYAAKFDNPYGVVVDDAVDAKAASYILSVQERFKLERLNSERKKPQEATNLGAVG